MTRTSSVPALGAACAALLLVACSSGAPSDAPDAATTATSAPVARSAPSSGPRSVLTDEQVRTTLQGMDEALAAGDVEAYLSHVDPAIAPSQRTWAEALLAVPMEVRQLRLDGVVSRNSPEGTVAHVGLRHQISGADPVPLLEQYRWTFAEDEDGAVRLVASAGRNGYLYGHPQVWDTGEQVAVLEGQHLLLLAPEPSRAEAEGLMETLDLAAARTLEAFPRVAEGRELLVVNLAQADLVEQLNGFPDGAAALQQLKVSPDEIPWDAPRLTGSDTPVHGRILLDLDIAGDDLDEFGPSTGGHPTLRHIAAAGALWGDDARLWPTDWVAEGVPWWWSAADDAELLGSLHFYAAEHAQLNGPPTSLPALPLRDDPEAYDSFALASLSFALHLAEEHGEASLVELAERLTTLDQRYDGDEIEQAYAEVLGVGEGELVERWADWATDLSERHGRITLPSVEG